MCDLVIRQPQGYFLLAGMALAAGLGCMLMLVGVLTRLEAGRLPTGAR